MDESGFSLVPPVRRTWSKKGKTPRLIHKYSWPKLSAISGVTLDQRLFLRLKRGVIKGVQILEFLRLLLCNIRGNILVIWDNISTHKSRLVRCWIENHPRIYIEPLPPYAPELNGDEGVWQYLKSHVVSNFCADNIDQLEKRIKNGAKSIRRKPNLIDSFVKQTGLI